MSEIVREPAVAGSLLSGKSRTPARGHRLLLAFRQENASHSVHGSSCRIHVLRTRRRGCIFAAGNSVQLHCARSQPHWSRASAGNNERRRMANAAGRIAIDSGSRRKTSCENFPLCLKTQPRIVRSTPSKSKFPSCKFCRPDMKFVPIAIGTGQLILLEQLGQALAEVFEKK